MYTKTHKNQQKHHNTFLELKQNKKNDRPKSSSVSRLFAANGPKQDHPLRRPKHSKRSEGFHKHFPPRDDGRPRFIYICIYYIYYIVCLFFFFNLVIFCKASFLFFLKVSVSCSFRVCSKRSRLLRETNSVVKIPIAFSNRIFRYIWMYLESVGISSFPFVSCVAVLYRRITISSITILYHNHSHVHLSPLFQTSNWFGIIIDHSLRKLKTKRLCGKEQPCL